MVAPSHSDRRTAEPGPDPGRFRPHLRNVRRALWEGPDDPPPVGRYGVRLVRTLVVALVILGVLLVVTFPFAPVHLRIGGLSWPWSVTVLLLSLAVMLLAVFRRPLLAWRLAWLVLVYEVIRAVVTAGRQLPGGRLDGGAPIAELEPLPHLVGFAGFPLPPLVVSPLQVAALLVVLFVVALSQTRGVVFWVWLLTVPLVAAVPVVRGLDRFGMVRDGFDGVYGPIGARPVVAAAGGVLLATVAVVAGQAVRQQARTRQQLAEEQERGLVRDERARLARELHDVVAHHVSMIAVRAETAPYRLGALSDQAHAEFAEISQASRESLAEMRRLLGVLRSDGPAPTGPQPGLADLAELVEWTRRAGTPVTLETHGALAGLPAAVDVSAYRILQEALTNAARHATGAAAHVRLERTGSELRLSVRNGPRQDRPGRAGRAGGTPAEGGHGVRGMRERAVMLGGELHAGPTGDGGFEVSATLPLRGGAA